MKYNAFGKGGGLAFRMQEERFGLRKAAFYAAGPRDFNLFRIPFIGLLGGVRVTGGAAPWFH